MSRVIVVSELAEDGLTILGVFGDEVHVDYFGQGVIIRATRPSGPNPRWQALRKAMQEYSAFETTGEVGAKAIKVMNKVITETETLAPLCPGMTLSHTDDPEVGHQSLSWFIYNSVQTLDFKQAGTDADNDFAYTVAAPPAPETYQVSTLDGLHIFEAKSVRLDIDTVTLDSIQGWLVHRGSRKDGKAYGPQHTCMAVRDMSAQALAAPHGAAASMMATMTALGAANAIRERMHREHRQELRVPQLCGYVRHTIEYDGSPPERRERIIGAVVEHVPTAHSWLSWRHHHAPPAANQQRQWATQIRTTLELLHQEGLAWAGAVGLPKGKSALRLLESVFLDSNGEVWLMRNFGPVGTDSTAAIASDNKALLELDAVLKL